MLSNITSFLKKNQRVLSPEEMVKVLFDNPVSFSDVRDFVQAVKEGYSRSTVFSSAHHELVVITWAPWQNSPIHSHGESSCAFRVVCGEGREAFFEKKDGILVRRPHSGRMERRLSHGSLCLSYAGEIHEMGSTSNFMVTLHLYSPSLVMETFPPPPEDFSKGLGI